MSIKTKKIKQSFFYKDDRGYIFGVFNSFKVEESNIIYSKAKSIRGKHFHKKLFEILHVLDGNVILYISHYKTPDKIKKIIKLKQRDTVLISPYEFHWTVNNNNARWINFLTKKIDPKKPDLHKIS